MTACEWFVSVRCCCLRLAVLSVRCACCSKSRSAEEEEEKKEEDAVRKRSRHDWCEDSEIWHSAAKEPRAKSKVENKEIAAYGLWLMAQCPTG